MTHIGATKKCWSCEAVTDYDAGWCPECYDIIPHSFKVIEVLWGIEPWAGAVRMALSNIVRNLRRPKPEYQRLTRTKPAPLKRKISLEDLEL